jgi:hypothetical protein
VRSPVLETEAGARREVPHGSADEYLAGTGERSDASTDVHGDAAPVLTAAFTLADMDSRVFTREVVVLEMKDSRYEVLSDRFVDMLDPPPLG